VATHWGFEDALEQRGDVTVVRDARWVRDGKVVTSQGVSAGIDMALWLVGQIDSPQHARAVQRYIQYDPAPPYQADA
jgi:transcriptional regulator GlxA family with amidase domain